MKVLWFSNCVLSREQSRGSGSWLYAMRDLISSDVEMVNVTDGNVSSVVFNKGNGISEYILPLWPLKNGIPEEDNIASIKEIVKKEHPDVIHIWGTEKYWALLFSRGYIQFENVILEVQGVLSSCEDVFWGGLTPAEIKNVRSLKTCLLPKYSQYKQYSAYCKRALLEREILPKFNYLATQSDWTRDQLLLLCSPHAHFFHSLRPVRKEFVEAKKWRPTGNTDPTIFFSYNYCVPFKGIHILLKAVRLLKIRYPEIHLRIAGRNFMTKPFYRIGDYEQLLKEMIMDYGLEENIHFCGFLKAPQMIEEIHRADVVVNPSFVESYSAAAAEALVIGVPTVLAYAGAMPGFSKDKPVALYYNPTDYRTLAAKIITAFEDERNRDIIRENAITVMAAITSPNEVKNVQLETYCYF